jgi:hypothetical protein
MIRSASKERGGIRVWPIALAVVLVVVAVGCALLAADVRSWPHAIRAGDLELQSSPATASWTPSTTLPGDPASRLLGTGDAVSMRNAIQSFIALEALGNGVDNGFSEQKLRGSLEATLTDLARTSDRAQASQADDLLGILAFADSRQTGADAPAPVERALSDFGAAVQADPSNAVAKFNLELLQRLLLAHGIRTGSNGSGEPSIGHHGAGGGGAGRGY